MAKDSRGQLQQALTLIREGKKEQAAKIIVPIIEREPDNANAWFLAANATDDEEEARYALEQVLRLRPGDERAQAMLLRLSAPLGDSGRKLTAAYNPDRQIGVDPLLIVGALIVMAIIAVAAVLLRPLLPGQGGPSGRIAYVSDDGFIYAITTTGGLPDQIVQGSDPAWAPSSNLMTYTRVGGGVSIINVLDGQVTNLTNEPTDKQPAWSPDGRFIAFSGVDQNNAPALFVIEVNGTNRRQVIRGSDPSWSPDSLRLIYQSDENNLYFDVFLISADGSNQGSLTRDSEFHDLTPIWSRTGLVFVSERDGNEEIYRTDVDGRNMQRLTQNGVPDTAPAWSPDGRFIVFVSTRDGNPDLYWMNADGSNVTRLTNTPATESSPSWGP